MSRLTTACAVSALLAGFVFAALEPVRSIVSTTVELPLNDPQDVAVEQDGDIYVAVGMYGRVQVYDRNGKFIRGFFTEGSGASQLSHEDEKLFQATARDRMGRTYDRHGHLCAVRPLAPDEWMDMARSPALDKDGNQYLIRGRLLNPRIVRIGKDPMTIRPAWWLIPFSISPIPWVLMIVTMITVERYLSRSVHEATSAT